MATGTTNGAAVSEIGDVVPGEVSADAITSSLQALLPTRHHEIARHRFTVLDTFDGRIRRAGACLTRDGVNGTSAIAWQSRGGGSHFADAAQPARQLRMGAPRWSAPAGGDIGHRRAAALRPERRRGARFAARCPRRSRKRRWRGSASRRARPGCRMRAVSGKGCRRWSRLTGLRGYEEIFERLVPVIESRPGIEPCPDGPLGVMLQQDWRTGARRPLTASA